jgi:hypothetical protein
LIDEIDAGFRVNISNLNPQRRQQAPLHFLNFRVTMPFLHLEVHRERPQPSTAAASTDETKGSAKLFASAFFADGMRSRPHNFPFVKLL